MKKMLLLVLSIFLILSFTGCGDDEGGNLSDEELSQVFQAIYTPQQSVMGSMFGGLPSPSHNISKAVTDYPFNYVVNSACGTCTVSGNYHLDDVSSSYSAEFSLVFDNYCYGGITINGNSDYTISQMNFSDMSNYSYSAVYEGNVTISGDVNSTCIWYLSFVCTASSISIQGTMTIDGTTYTYNWTYP